MFRNMLALAALLACAAPAAASIANFKEVDPGVYRGSQPRDGDWAYLKSLGIKTIVKLDLPSEGSDEAAKKLGIAVLDLSGPPSELGDMMGAPRPERIRLAVKALADEKLRPVYVHCLHGQDRTGLIVGLYRVVHDHYTKKQAYGEMTRNGFHRELHGLREIWEAFDGKTLPGETRSES